jgi:hypothetical protein
MRHYLTKLRISALLIALAMCAFCAPSAQAQRFGKSFDASRMASLFSGSQMSAGTQRFKPPVHPPTVCPGGPFPPVTFPGGPFPPVTFPGGPRPPITFPGGPFPPTVTPPIFPPVITPPVTPAVTPVGLIGIPTPLPQFRTGQLLADHYAKHVKGLIVKRDGSGMIVELQEKLGGPDLPEFNSLEEYRTAAGQMWARDGVSIVERSLSNGDKVRFDTVDGTFGVLSRDGYIRTFVRPDKGYEYFLYAIR